MSLNTKLALPIALGLSLVTVTAFVAYYVLKRDEEENDNKTVKITKINTIEIHVPKSIVPALIGRNGSNIKDLQKKSGAQIHFKKFTDQDYDVCVVRGRADTTQLAETLIHDFIKQQPTIMSESITVPSWSCGRIIGSGGENVNDISHRSGARVKVESPKSTDKVAEHLVTFRGTKEQIEVAKKLVENCISLERCRREIEQSKRPPRHSSSPPSPCPSPGDRDADADAQGDVTHTRVKYKRPETTGPSIEVYVSAVSSPSRFWVQFVGPQVAQLDDLVAHMTEYYSKKENREAHTLRHVSVGQVVAAVFRHDGRWYRARVHDIRPNEFDSSQQVADVFYLDYGDSEYVATHELCELRADLLRLRFQAMECFLAGVRPASGEEAVSPSGQRWDKWHPQAVERFEELTQVARWKALVSRTCTYKKTATAEGEKDKEIPGIKLFDVTDEGELDVGAVLVAEGWAVAGPAPSPRPSPPRGHTTPFGDLSKSKVLSMTGGGGRSSSVPKDHKDDGSNVLTVEGDDSKDKDGITASKSLASGLEKSDRHPLSISNFDLSYPDPSRNKQLNGSDDFLHGERQNIDNEITIDTLVPPSPLSNAPILSKTLQDEFKANMNRIDSHHSNLENLGKSAFEK
ncbi:tudor and KH domain-containing protein homolog isoform X1 [Bombyx mori]|uniref:Tudor domain-containing protein n=1 Tax=Bombyx mori TaxID=7091 RepID=A0A8R2M8R4_BOMMO|nr:tudor and KH domain-containing protein homolog isoform X1 [Bombyx mori]